jgi:PAS domain S-box-containing protein
MSSPRLPEFPYELIAPIRTEAIAITPYWRIIDVSSNAWQFLTGHPASLEQPIDVREYLPEIVGLERELHQVLSGSKSAITIAGIHRDHHPDTAAGFYFDLQIQLQDWDGLSEQQLVIRLEDVTPKMLLEQSFVQYSNETALIQNQLQASQQYTQRIIDSILDSVVVTDLSGTIKNINPSTQKLLGFSPIDLRDQNIFTLVRDHRQLQQLRQNAMTTAQPALPNPASALLELTCTHEQGHTIAMECACTLLQSAVEGYQGYVYTFRDIRDRQAAQAKLAAQTQALIQANQVAQKANQLKSDFIATVSHEIRTPINAIVGMTELMQNTSLDPEQQHFISTIKTSSEILLSLINDILDLSKLESGHLEINVAPCDLRDCISNSIGIFQLTAQQKQLKLLSNIHPSVPKLIHSDAQRINQILINLLGNAIKFTNAGFVSLDVTAKRQTNAQYEITFTITDTGIGIDPQQQQRLFQPFCQADASIAQTYGGTGLGLSISKQLTTLLGGTISVASQPGRGSKFIFTIVATAPSIVAAPAPIATLPATTSPTASAAAAPLKILIAEDNRVNQTLLLKMLQHFGYEADIAENGLQVLDRLAQQSYDLIFMDCQMPELDGYATTQAIHQRFTPTDRPKIIAITAQAQESDRQRCQAIGMDSYLSKPIRLADLEKLLQQYQPRPHQRQTTATSSQSSPDQPGLIDHQVLAELQQVGGSTEFVTEMIHCYRQQSTQLIAQLQNAIAAQSITEMIALVHKLSGSSNTIGATTLASQCDALEQFASNLSSHQLKSQIEAIIQTWQAVEYILSIEF